MVGAGAQDQMGALSMMEVEQPAIGSGAGVLQDLLCTAKGAALFAQKQDIESNDQ